MTLPEFKAWFEGFTESMSGPPNKKQWERIQARIGEITGQAVSHPVYIDRYVRPLQPYWGVVPYNGLPGLYGAAGGVTYYYTGNALAAQTNNARCTTNASFNSCDAMAEVGRADARALAA